MTLSPFPFLVLKTSKTIFGSFTGTVPFYFVMIMARHVGDDCNTRVVPPISIQSGSLVAVIWIL